MKNLNNEVEKWKDSIYKEIKNLPTKELVNYLEKKIKRNYKKTQT